VALFQHQWARGTVVAAAAAHRSSVFWGIGLAISLVKQVIQQPVTSLLAVRRR